MGGSNSGRWPRQHVTLEGCRSLTLDINHLLRGERAAALLAENRQRARSLAAALPATRDYLDALRPDTNAAAAR